MAGEAWTAGNPFLGQDNPYLNDIVANATGDIVRQYNTITKPQLESAGVNSGSFGNSGVQQMQQNALNDVTRSIGNTAANLRFNDYNNQQNMYRWDQEFNRGLSNDAYSQNMNNLQAGINLLGLSNQYQNQSLNNANTIQNTPLNYWQQFANQMNGLGQGYGTQTTTSQGSGSPLTGALGGWQLGGAIAKSWGNSGNGGSAGGVSGYPDYGLSTGGNGAWV